MTETVKLFCIPFSGGSSFSYSVFQKYLPGFIEFDPLELPGRGRRIAEPLLDSIEEMNEDLFRQIGKMTDKPYAIYGHSLGALLGIELCRAISARGSQLPIGLFLSGLNAPSRLENHDRYDLPDPEFIDMIRKLEGTPEELLSDEGFLQYFLPVVRADFRSMGEFAYTPRNAPLDVPLDLFFGSGEEIGDDDAAAWQSETDGPVRVHRFEGGHFFIFTHAEQICSVIAEEISGALRPR